MIVKDITQMSISILTAFVILVMTLTACLAEAQVAPEITGPIQSC